MGWTTLQLSIGGGLGGLFVIQSALLMYQHRKLRHYKAANHSLKEELQASRTLDEITGAWNYPFFVKAANLLVKNARRRREPLTMILVDLDSLEKINLRHSYAAGDAVLKHLFRRLRRIVGKRALIGRFGGSGFFILLEQCDEQRALDYLEDLRLSLTEDVCKLQRKRIEYSVSMSAVTMHGRQITLGTMLDAVEDSLDKVKKSGKVYGFADRGGKLMKTA